jgi:hypothetical protein
MLKLSQGEIESYSRDISEILESIPLFYVYEVLELANEKRQRENEIEGVDTTDSSEEEDNYNADSSSSEEDN